VTRIAANLFALAGMAALVAAGWLVHPSAGLAVAGLLCLITGIGMLRSAAP
jgi:hypothetical protein